MKQIIRTSQAPAPIGPYTQAVRINDLLFASGQIAIDPATGRMVQSSLEEETRRVMENIRAILREAGTDFPNVVKTSIFLTDIDDFALVNRIYGEYFDDPTAPARECVQVAALPKGARVEISVTAHLG